MKILHTSDWHLGKFLGGVSLEADQAHALAQLADHLAAEPYDLLVIAGDIFDRSTPSPDSVRVLGGWLGRLRRFAPDLPVVLIAGNHDNGPRLAWTASVLDQQGIYLRGETDAVAEPILVRGRDGVEAQVWALPFLMPGALGEPVPSQVGAMDEALRRIRERQDPAKAQVLVAHCFVQNSQTSDSERTLVGTATQIDVAVFAGFDYVALGHLHRPQAPAPHVRYCGSLARYSFSEVHYPKMFLSVEVAPGQPCQVVEQPFRDLRGMHRISASLEQLLHAPEYAAIVGDYVELSLDPPVDVGNPLEQLRTRWSHILSFHNELAPVSSALMTMPDGFTGKSDLEADFRAFDRQFTDQEAPDAEVLAAFRKLHQRLPAEVLE
jgi:exonuclease SbcD